MKNSCAIGFTGLKMEKEQLLILREHQCKHLGELAKSKQITPGKISEITGYDRSNILRVLRGQYAPTLDVLNNIAAAIGYTVAFTNTDTINATVEGVEPKFLFCPDHKNNELYILHRNFPSCLIWVKQEMPVRFIILDLYDDLENEADILNMPFIQEAKEFFSQMVENSMDKN